MKIKNILPIFLFLITFPFYGQNENMDEKREKIKAYKVSFLTTELDLTSAESEKFWPIYNAYDDKQFELRLQKMKAYTKKLTDEALKNMSEKEAASLVYQIETTDEELFLLRKKFTSSLKKILPAKKIIILRKSEDDFNRKLLHQYRDKAGKN
ncbi:sensor of ECF-type sigma factor [Flavobacterium sp. LS1R47]|uniref:Sensor of ECF-type sigma factor n=1 Tax=Flavobacterium frigoritolerans TaxID=2987686 RepID=A0A9X3C1B5_9FLAO|nr:sensor of ECF-type sigma factor [Flavobacterium frigoritolerans]MCV9932995.1 sensor of ECF-type sigma factor [Flavobacterium frigoritolerans]